MRMVDSSHDCLPLVDRISPLIIMQVSILHYIHLILIYQFFQMHGQLSFLGVSINVGRVEGPVCAYNDPLYARVVPCLAEIFFEEIVLLRAIVVGMFGGEMHEMNLSVVEGEVKVGLMGEGPWQYVSVEVGSVVVVCLMIANAGHEGSVGCKFLGQLSKQVPDWCTLATSLAVHPSVCDISSQENNVKRGDQIVFCDLVDHKRSEGRKGAHISKHRDVHFLQNLISEWWSGKIFYLGEGPCLTISHSIVISLKRVKIFHGGHVNPSFEASYFSDIVGMEGTFCNVLEHARYPPILNDGLIIMLRV